jgi:hypothetical protein
MPAHVPEGFLYLERKSGDIEVRRFGTLAAVLRGREAERFRARASGATELELQHLMARATGNYKRGNERRS